MSVEILSSSTSEPSSKASLQPHKRSPFMHYGECVEEGDTVMIYVSYGTTHPVVVRRGLTLTMKYGALRHEFIIGKPWGSRLSATAGYVHVLRPSAELWTRCLPRRTQILYTHDCALILQLLDAKPGSIICESGTGSGSLSHAIALAVAPSGRLYTHDIEEIRREKIEAEFDVHGLSNVGTAVVQNVCTDGFCVSDTCDGVFLDVPAPWEAVPHAASAISRARGGRIVSFSPCIEQVQRTCEVLRNIGFVQIETVEVVPTSLKVVEERRQTLSDFDAMGDQSVVQESRENGKRDRKRKLNSADGDDTVGPQQTTTAITFPNNQPTHTGYLTHATMLCRK